VASKIDYRVLKDYNSYIFAFTILMLLAVLSPHVGTKVNGARRWLSLGHGSIGFQPSEFAKTALIICVAWYGERYRRQMDTVKRGLVMPALLVGSLVGLVFVEPDRGTSILMAAVAGGMLFIAGARWKFIIPSLMMCVLLIGISMRGDKMRNDRVEAWKHPELYKTGVGYQTYQGLLALGSGGVLGLGLGESREKLGFLPEKTTDFILPIIGEELGLVATLSIVGAFMLLTFAGFYIAANAPDTFGRLLATGITLLFSIQAFINIAVVTNTIPNKGMPLPFISRGGSNLLIMLINVGLLLSIARKSNVLQPFAETVLEAPQNPFAEKKIA
jgi:cell division protein FtsW